MAAQPTDLVPRSHGKSEPDRPAADEAAETPAGKAQGDGWKAWVPLGVALLVMPALAYAVTTFVLVPRMQKITRAEARGADPVAKESPVEPGEGKENLPTGQKQTATLNKLLVNVAGTMGSRYLLTTLALAGRGADFTSRVSQNEAQLRDLASGLLSAKTIADLEKPGARNLIRGELISGFNGILGNAAVQEIYFTDFAIQ